MIEKVLPRLAYPDTPKVGDLVCVVAQIGDRGTYVYRRKGSPVCILDRESAKYSQLKVGSVVSGKVLRILENSVITSVEDVDDPVMLPSIKTTQSVGQPRPVGRLRDGRVVLFHDSSPVAADIRVDDTVTGVVIQETDTYVQVYPQQREPASLSETALSEQKAAEKELFPPIHPFVPWILNELVPASIGKLRPEIVGLVEATTTWQAFEDLVTAAFRLLDFGDVHPLGWHKTGQSYPDGYVFSPNRKVRDYIISYDTKQRSGQSGFSHSVEDVRAFEDYLRSAPYYQGVRKKGIVVVAHSFAKEPPSIREGTVTYLPADLLARIVTMKIMNETLVTHEVLEPILFSGTIVDSEQVNHWEEHHNLRDLGKSQSVVRP